MTEPINPANPNNLQIETDQEENKFANNNTSVEDLRQRLKLDLGFEFVEIFGTDGKTSFNRDTAIQIENNDAFLTEVGNNINHDLPKICEAFGITDKNNKSGGGEFRRRNPLSWEGCLFGSD